MSETLPYPRLIDAIRPEHPYGWSIVLIIVKVRLTAIESNNPLTARRWDLKPK
ncbi:hypothetical protein [Moorena sp. SIO3I6]|uniref:hypothetical protein n=1 Tax=Moorena sp. SIO3I6 TaxID=2607831 RepID=UPI0013FAD9C5|nr:hypothetical protein [Moorena sp. SIO3I6]NEP27214.1 hypothetical protein [Moorena sp. SIO3I6]